MQRGCSKRVRIFVGEVHPLREILVWPHTHIIARFQSIRVSRQEIYHVARSGSITPPPRAMNVDVIFGNLAADLDRLGPNKVINRRKEVLGCNRKS